MKSWEIFDAARKHSKAQLCAIWGNRSSRLIDYWAQDPAFCADPKRNPIDRMEMLLQALDKEGLRPVAVALIRLLAGAIDCKVVDRRKVVPDKETLQEEIIDDFPFLAEYQKALQGDDLEAVDHAEEELRRELAENRVRFIEQVERKKKERDKAQRRW